MSSKITVNTHSYISLDYQSVFNSRLTLEASDVPQMKLCKRDVGDFRSDAADIHRRDEFQVLFRTLVNNASSRATVDPHREVLLDRKKLSHVRFTIGDHFVAVHRRGWVVTHVV